MKVKCINQGNFRNVTEGKEYEVISEDARAYKIKANDGDDRNYSKGYFEVIPEPVIEDIDEIGVAEEKQPEFTVEWGDDSNILICANGNSVLLEYCRVASNCGVASYHGVNWLLENCDENIDLFKDIIKSIIELIEESSQYCMFILSTNSEYTIIWDALDEIMDFESETVENPNSDMDVKLWIKYV